MVNFSHDYDQRGDFDFTVVNFSYLSNNIPVDTICSGLFEIRRFSVQRIYSGFKVIETGIFFTETSDYFFRNSMVVK